MLFCACLLFSLTQAQTPYNPDSDGDNLIGINDVLDFLPYFGSEFFPEPIEPEILEIGPDNLINVDTVGLYSTAVVLHLDLSMDATTDVVLVNVDPLRLALNDQYTESNISLDISVHLPEVDSYKTVAIAYTGEFALFNGTGITIDVLDDNGLTVGQFQGYYSVNRIRKFVNLGGKWFADGGPDSD